MKTVQKKVGEFDVAVTFYTQNVMVIIHNKIPGVGNIIYAEKEDKSVICEQLMGQENEYLTLLAMRLAEEFMTPNITFVFAFHPSKMETFDHIRNFVDDFHAALNTE